MAGCIQKTDIVWCMWTDGYTGLPGGCIRERPNELQWRPGSDDSSADNFARATSRGHVCVNVAEQPTPAPRHLQWEGQSHHTSAVCPAQTGTLDQTQTYSYSECFVPCASDNGCVSGLFDTPSWVTCWIKENWLVAWLGSLRWFPCNSLDYCRMSNTPGNAGYPGNYLTFFYWTSWNSTGTLPVILEISWCYGVCCD